MDKGTLLDRVASSGEERTLLARVLDKYEQMERRNIPTATVFLSEAEQAATQRLLNAAGIMSGYVFNGGYDGAARKILQFLPDWAEEDESALGVIKAVYRGEDAPDHRACLGSLMGLGIVREKVGDILITPDFCQVIAAADILPFLLQNWSSAGRVHLVTEEISLSELVVPEQQFKVIKDTVMSLRLDAVTSTGFSISRTKAAELISSGRVQLNHTECTKTDRSLNEGDVITARGFGKCILAEVGGLSKKGRTAIVVKRYL